MFAFVVLVSNFVTWRKKKSRISLDVDAGVQSLWKFDENKKISGIFTGTSMAFYASIFRMASTS